VILEKRALITGVTGMVGSHLLDFLMLNTNWEIHGLSRWRSSLENIENHLQSANRSGTRFKLWNADLNDSFSLQKVISEVQPEFIFHLAAQSFPKTSFDSPIETLSTNIIGTANLLEVIRRSAPSAMVHVCSSSEVFGRVPKDKVPIKESESFHPASPYAISKAGTDLLGRFYFEAYGLKTIITRMFTHTGPRRGDVFAESSFAKQIALAEKGIIQPVVKVGNLESLRTIADVRDAVRAYHLLLTHNPIPGAYYNIGGNHTCKVSEILEFLISISTLNNLRVEVDPERLRPIDADLQIPDTSAFRSHTGWEPKITFQETLSDLLDYWRAKVPLSSNWYVR
jgi:GDP-mannose 4,6-dehydratase